VIATVDVSGWNAPLDWSRVAAAGISVAWVKATDGLGSPDARWALHTSQAAAAGLIVGSYHYLRIRHGRPQDARQQVREYLGRWRAHWQLRPVLDVESGGNEAATSAEWSSAVCDAVAEVEQLVGVSPVIYTSRGEWEGRGLGALTSLDRCPLWLACYGATATVPKPWGEYALWQYTGDGVIPGVPGVFDLSRGESAERLLTNLAAVP